MKSHLSGTKEAQAKIKYILMLKGGMAFSRSYSSHQGQTTCVIKSGKRWRLDPECKAPAMWATREAAQRNADRMNRIPESSYSGARVEELEVCSDSLHANSNPT